MPEKYQKIFKWTIIIFEIILPFILAFLCQRLSIGRGYESGITNPASLLIKYILWGSVFLFFLGLFKKNYLALFFYLLLFSIFSLANRYKIKFLGQPLELSDLSLVKQGAFNFISPILERNRIRIELIGSLLFLITSFFIFKKIIHLQIKNIFIRLALIIFSISILGSSYFFPNSFNKVMEKFHLSFNQWDSPQNCRQNGMLLCFIYNFQFLKHDTPTNYNQANIQKIFENIPSSTMPSNESNIKPTTIIILSESLWDATQLPNTTFSQDPLKYFRPDIKGSFISPAFGGETANIEFELLTGLNNYFFEKNSFPYSEFIRKNTPSIFTLFKDHNYTTTVIHPYAPWFYNRQTVYKYFGLDKFTSIDNMNNYETIGSFVSAKSFTNEIIKQYNETDNPQLIFAISIQNHGPYEANRFPDGKINIKSSLNENNQSILESYTDGINLSNQYYQVLKQEIIKSKKPTNIILFGDHLPAFDGDYNLYKEAGFIPKDETQWSLEDKIKMQSTPLILWSNYQKNIKDIGKISPAFLSNTILNLANIKPEYQFKLTNQLRQEGISFLNKRINPNLNIQSGILNEYNLVQYDILFGKQYTWNFK